MKKTFVIVSIFVLVNSCLLNNENSFVEKDIEYKINIIVNDRKIYLSNLIYENELNLIRKKYNIKNESNFSDISSIKIEEEFGMYSLFGEYENRQIIDPLGDNIVNKWKALNYDPNYYFHYDKIVTNIHLSFLKMMDFYNSEDMHKYEDSLKISLINRYNNKEPLLLEYLKNEYNFKNRMIWKYQNDSILTLIPVENIKINPIKK